MTQEDQKRSGLVVEHRPQTINYINSLLSNQKQSPDCLIWEKDNHINSKWKWFNNKLSYEYKEAFMLLILVSLWNMRKNLQNNSLLFYFLQFCFKSYCKRNSNKYYDYNNSILMTIQNRNLPQNQQKKHVMYFL